MAFKLMDMKVSAVLPEIPTDLPVFFVRAASLEERKPAIQLLQELLKLDKIVPIDEGDAICYEGANGEIEFYRSSGSLWAESWRKDANYADERRDWKTIEIADANDPNNNKLVLNKDDEDRLATQAKELFCEAGLLSSKAVFSGVALDQAAKLDEEGKEIERFVGEANVRFLYHLDGLAVDGPGAKTYAFFNPSMDGHGHTLSGVYHAWRIISDKRKVRLARIDEILEQSLIRDPELCLYHDRGCSIEVQQVEVVYWAFRPDVHQNYLFPTLRVDGSVVYKEPSKEFEGFEFSRYYNAVAPNEYAASRVYAEYLVKQFV